MSRNRGRDGQDPGRGAGFVRGFRRNPTQRPAVPSGVRRIFGTLLATVLTTVVLATTAACGSSSSSVATDPASDPAGNPSRSPGSVAGAHVLPLISMTGGGGRQTASAQPLDTAAQVAAFLRQLGPTPLRARVRSAIAAAPADGRDLFGQVIAIGCDRPPGAGVVVGTDGRVQIVAQEVASPLQECLAAVTTVALASVPSAG
jgi:hypothetical protein